MDKLEKKLGYKFSDISLLQKALTHRSVSKNNNERLEFLGDSVLGCIISEELYRLHSDIDEGQLSRLRSHLVRGKTLANLSKKLNISENLTLGQGELKSGGFRRESILADAFEAILGAIFLDSDYLTVKKTTLALFSDLINELKSEDLLKDFKTDVIFLSLI